MRSPARGTRPRGPRWRARARPVAPAGSPCRRRARRRSRSTACARWCGPARASAATREVGAPERIVLERPAAPGRPGGPALVIVTFDEAGRGEDAGLLDRRPRGARPAEVKQSVSRRFFALVACALLAAAVRGRPRPSEGGGGRRTSRPSPAELEQRDREQRSGVRGGGRPSAPAEGAAAPRGDAAGVGRGAGAGRSRLLRAPRAAGARPGAAPGATAPEVEEALALLERIRAASRRSRSARASSRPACRSCGPRPSPCRGGVTQVRPPRATSRRSGRSRPRSARRPRRSPGPIEAYEWVRNAIRPELYHGVMKGPAQTLLEGERQRRRHRGAAHRPPAREGHPRAVRPRHRGPSRAPRRRRDRHRERRARPAGLPARGDPERARGGPGGIAALRVERVWARGLRSVRQLPRGDPRRAREGLGASRPRPEAPRAAGGLRRPLRRLRPGEGLR